MSCSATKKDNNCANNHHYRDLSLLMCLLKISSITDLMLTDGMVFLFASFASFHYHVLLQKIEQFTGSLFNISYTVATQLLSGPHGVPLPHSACTTEMTLSQFYYPP
eukprot:GHVU01190769.1.p2 GENE.GHVU01190769.1~~GHVU01190769.1.p2  ORF type:complete len:107 (+),score=2.51 GHVU01190769.1:267-587(+)